MQRFSPLINTINLVRDTVELTVISIASLYANIMLGICPVDTNVGNEMLSHGHCHVSLRKR